MHHFVVSVDNLEAIKIFGRESGSP